MEDFPDIFKPGTRQELLKQLARQRIFDSFKQALFEDLNYFSIPIDKYTGLTKKSQKELLKEVHKRFGDKLKMTALPQHPIQFYKVPYNPLSPPSEFHTIMIGIYLK